MLISYSEYKCFILSRVIWIIWLLYTGINVQSQSFENRTTNRALADSLFWVAENALETREIKTALPLAYKADSLYQKLQLPKEVIKAKLLEYHCQMYTTPRHEWGAPIYEALPFIARLENPDMTLVKLYIALGSLSNANNQTTIAHYYISQAFALIESESFIDHPDYDEYYIRVLYRLGSIEERRYNYKKAEEYYLLARTKSQINKSLLHLSFDGLFTVYTNTDQHEKVKGMLQEFKAENYEQTQPLFFIYDFYTAHLDYLIRNMQYEKALERALHLKSLLTTDKFKSHFSAWFLSDRIAQVYGFLEKYQLAIDELLTAQTLKESMDFNPHWRANLFIRLGQNYLQLEDLKKAQYYCEEALTNNIGIKNTNTSFHKSLDLSKAEKAHKSILLDNLLFKAQLAEVLYIKTKDNTYLATKKQTYETAHELIKRMGYMSNEDAFLSDDQFKRVYGELMSIYQKEWNSSADPTLFEKAMTLRLQSQYVTMLNELNTKQNLTNITSIPFIKRLKETYNSYNTILYLWGQDAIYILNSYKERQQFDKIPLTDALKKAIDTHIQQTRDYRSSIDTNAQQLIYKTLVEKYIQPEAKTAILPDDKLHLLPFESLWIHSDQKEQYMLAKSPIIRITNSTISKAPLHHTKALVLAPFASQAGMFNTRLSKSLEETQAINAYFKNDVYLDAKATKSSFIDQLVDATMIHLATHATANTYDPSQSYIQFYEETAVNPLTTRLGLEEIYNLDLQASIVTLSACETGVGRDIKGKGVQSMANAFTYAGAASTVMSLWKVPDTETATIMKHFYENLHKGLPKDEALQQSKLQYIEANADYPELQHPFYWSGFVISGDPSPLSISKGSPLKSILIGGLLILLVNLILWNRNRLFQLIKN